MLAMMAADRASAALGIVLVAHGAGWALTRMTIRDDMVNGYRLAHGGLLFTLADTAFACACNSWGRPTVAAGCEIVFVAPARLGDVVQARAEARTRYRRHGVYDVTISRGTEVIAEFRGRSYQVRPQ